MQPDEPKLLVSTHKEVELPQAVKTVIFTVERNVQGGSELMAQPGRVELNEGEQIVWTSSSGRLEIRFDPANTPFAGDRYETGRGGRMYSGPLIPQKQARKSYTYTTLITTKDGAFVAKSFELVVNWPSPPSAT